MHAGPSSRSAKKRVDGGQSNRAGLPKLMPQRTGSGADVIPVGASGTETLRAQLRNRQAEEALLLRVQHTQHPLVERGNPHLTAGVPIQRCRALRPKQPSFQHRGLPSGDRTLPLGLNNPSSREKLKLVWKTTAKSVHAFMETLPPGTRDRYSALCQALTEEYKLFTDEASATLGAFAVMQRRN